MKAGRLTSVLFLAAAVGLTGAEVEKLVLSQVNPQLPVMTAYLDILDGNGGPVRGLSPANFSAALGSSPVKVSATEPFLGTGEGVAYVFLVDVSKSISPRDFDQMKAAIEKWINGLKERDRAALCTFGEDYRVVADFTADKQKLISEVGRLSPKDQHTRLYQAINSALELERRVDPALPARRVAVLMSDGKDEGSGITPEDVLPSVRTNHISIYSIGYSRLPASAKQKYLDVLRRFSTLSGGTYSEVGANGIDAIYSAIQQAILRVYAIRLSCSGCAADGNAYPLEITLSQEGRGLKDMVFVTPLAAPVLPAHSVLVPWWQETSFWISVLAGVAVFVVLAAIFMRRRGIVPPAQPSLPPESRAESAEVRGKATDEAAKQESKLGTPMKLTVVIGREPGRSYRFRLDKTALIGRSQDCDVVLPDAKVSNRHCEIAMVNGQVMLFDLDSTNSTLVNGVPIRGRQKLDDRDSIQVGETELRLHLGES